MHAGGTLLWTWLPFTLVTPLSAAAMAWRFVRWVHHSETVQPTPLEGKTTHRRQGAWDDGLSQSA